VGELTRLRITRRADTEPLPDDGQVPVYPLGAGQTELIKGIIGALWLSGAEEQIRGLGLAFIDSGAFLDPAQRTTEDAVLAKIFQLDDWVARHPSATLSELTVWVSTNAVGTSNDDSDADGRRRGGRGRRRTSGDGDIDGSEDSEGVLASKKTWTAFRTRLADSLVAAMISGTTWPPTSNNGRPYTWVAETTSVLTRYVLLCGLLEVARPQGRADPLISNLMRRTPVLPSPPFPLPFRSRLARMPAFSDMYVVKDEWASYVPGEIAFIENVLKGEYKERARTVVDEVRTTETRAETVTTATESETQTTDRSLLKDESTEDTNLTVGVEGQVDTSGQYGPTHVETHIGASVQYSRAESRHRAMETAHETVDRAISRTESVVMESRTRSVLQRTVDKNRHVVNNATKPDGHVVGIYRWVDKIQRMQIFRFPNRYLLEFEVPEPATFVRWLADNQEKPQGVLTEPDALTDTGKKDGKQLTVDDMTPGTYTKYAARYAVTGLPEVPAREISVAESWIVDAGERKAEIDNYGSIPFSPSGAKDKEMAIPDGYAAVSAVASVSAAPQLAKWKDWTDWDNTPPGGDGVHEEIGWHEIVATLEVAGRTAIASTEDRNARPGNTVERYPKVYHSFWLNEEFRWTKNGVKQRTLEFDTRPTGKVSVSGTVGGAYKASISVSITCSPTEATWSSWRTEVYARIAAAHADQLARWRTEQASLAEESLIPLPTGSPARHREVIREELKRQVIEMLIGDTFDGINALTPTNTSWSRANLDVAQESAPYIQFLEQAFEWANLTYILYPYYWAASERWSTLEQIESSDAEFDRFLRSGSARVVVSARPGFEHAVNYFMTFGLPWGGGPAPVPGTPLYVSIAQEIKDLTQAPVDGIPEETWEARVPTTLIWLDDDSSIPKDNADATLPVERS
jgi:hypothetical protein